MKILKLLSNFIIFIIFLVILQPFKYLSANEPVDIWNLDKKNIENKNVFENKEDTQSIYQLEPTDLLNNDVIKDEDLINSDISLIGLYDPEIYSLSIDMWTNSDGKNIKSILDRINQESISRDANLILDIALLTNSYPPNKNINQEEFYDFKINYLKKKNDLDLIKKFVNNNPDLKKNIDLIKFYSDQFLSYSDIDNACSIFDSNKIFNDSYLTKFKIYCLIHNNNRDEAQLIYDLIIESGFKDKFFEDKFNFLMGYSTETTKKISEKNILEFHLSHRTNMQFDFLPDENTNQIIWDYLSSSNLLEDVNLIDLENEEKIKVVEKATHQKNYREIDLFNLYKRFQFNINQLLTVQDSYKLMPTFKGRALLYQKLLLSKDDNEILDLSFRLKSSFKDDGIENAFNDELTRFLKLVDGDNVPSNYTTFYEKNMNLNKDNEDKKIKLNNKIIHQSKLINYFLNKQNIQKTEKDLNDLLKKVKKNKKYFISKKDIILIETLKSDGITVEKKYKNLYEINSNIPNDIVELIENSEMGMVLLRLVEIIGQDEINNLDIDTIEFIISALNRMNMDVIRNKIILEIMPLRV